MLSLTTISAVLALAAYGVFRRKRREKPKTIKEIAEESRSVLDSGEIKDLFKRLRS